MRGRKNIKPEWRLKAFSLIYLLLFIGLILRLIYWQIIRRVDLSEKAKGQYNSSQIMNATRGNILASDGSYWALRTDAWLVYANTNELKAKVSEVSVRLATLLNDDESRLSNLLSKKEAYVPLKQKVDNETKKNIEALGIKGINFDNQEARYYPEASSAAQLLGFVGKDEKGLDIGYFGLEGYYNLPLSGKPGFLGREKDAQGSPILLNPGKSVSAIGGIDLITSIDKRVQILAETKLKDGIEKYGALGGSITIEDPRTGEILAMASYPSYDPGNYSEYGNSFFKNPVISDSFEPGSIMKVRNNVYHPNITMTDVIVDSDNVGMVFVGQKLGADRLYNYLDSFGIGQLTGVDLQGESAPSIRKKGEWSMVDLATASFGQGIAVTGIQMIRAVSAIANGGYLERPRVVKSVRGEGWEEKIKSEPSKRVVSSAAATEVTQMMVAAADKGEAKWAKIPGFKVAGKTGTAQIPVEGHYDSTNTNHSFIGFAPADKPKFVMLVTLKSPQSSPWAAETAAPLWYSVAKDLFPYLGIEPNI
ncbi:MAG: Peptidoglycan glycosyltransferase [Candidatus Woesebacteria bacterium GW2011_GWA2_40_7]|uniref:Peptidoglycan glycosyltransferase n=1 Tax=Candidatus Woesebacteria bacterium GW2011_GWA2_40_7 TaxID=1618562 RepID=A0A0G0TBG7_9BACT|nr:MAG: Peptidoglycan glycosyltransferase [Candidatus Woesebacteria bacterium GW2011_GWA2_40_7]